MAEDSCTCSCCCDSATNENDLKIAILQAALDLALKQGHEGDDAPMLDRRYASSCITAFKKALGVS